MILGFQDKPICVVTFNEAVENELARDSLMKALEHEAQHDWSSLKIRSIYHVEEL